MIGAVVSCRFDIYIKRFSAVIFQKGPKALSFFY